MEHRVLHTLTVPGVPVQAVVVKVLGHVRPAAAAAAAASSSESAGARAELEANKASHSKGFSRVLVGDESACMDLVYRSTRGFDPVMVKRGRFLVVTGVVSCHLGSLALLCGPRPQDLQLLKHGVSMGPPAPFPNLSRVIHHAGTLLVRPLASCAAGGFGGPPFVLQFGLMLSEACTTARRRRRTLYVGTTLPRSHESFPVAAHRALLEATGEEEDGEDCAAAGVASLQLPSITEYHEHDGTTHCYHFFIDARFPRARGADDSLLVSAEGGDECGGGATTFVWRTLAQIHATTRARRRQGTATGKHCPPEDARHVVPIVKKARSLLEDALRHGALDGPGWTELREYLTGNEDGEGEGEGVSLDKPFALLADAAAGAKGNAASDIRPLPVTVLSGFLGAGKTTMLKHLLQNQKGWKLAVLVNDMAEVNVDAELVERVVDRREERVISLSNGCVCCTLREDLLEQVLELAKAQEFDYLVVEASGISESMPVAETFAFEDGAGNAVADFARLDTTVTVVDAHAMRANLSNLERAGECSGGSANRGSIMDGAYGEATEGAAKTLASLWVDQVEFADVVVLNKTDLLLEEIGDGGEAELANLTAMIQKLNPGARVVCASYGAVEVDAVMNTGLFSLEKAQSAPGWLQELRQGEHVPETEEYGVSSFVYRRRRPFHPRRLHALVLGSGGFDGGPGVFSIPSVPSSGTSSSSSPAPLAGLVRVKGYIWLATRSAHIVFWSLAGAVGHSFSCNPHDAWLAATDPSEWPEGLQMETAAAKWEPLWGDRRCEVVFIGCIADRTALEAALDGCLLTDEEMALGPRHWRESFDDPFPAVVAEKDEEEDDDDDEGWEGSDDEDEEGWEECN